MGPPNTLPFSALMRYFTASRPSAYLVEIPKRPVSQHHNTAPGPPSDTAVATPIILPVPMVAAKAVANAPNCDTSPWAFLSLLMLSFMALRRNLCGKRSRMVRKICVPNNRIIIGQPHRSELTSERNSVILFILGNVFHSYSNIRKSHRTHQLIELFYSILFSTSNVLFGETALFHSFVCHLIHLLSV